MTKSAARWDASHPQQKIAKTTITFRTPRSLRFARKFLREALKLKRLPYGTRLIADDNPN